MECSICKELYDLKCLNVASDAFNKYSQDFKHQWICPCCINARPKRNNADTPVRSPANQMSSVYTVADNVTMTRGSRKQGKIAFSPPENTEISDLVSEIRHLRKEVIELKEQLSSVCFTLTEKLDLNVKKVIAQEIEIQNLRESLTNLQLAANQHEQYSLRNELELAGIPEAENENLHHAVMVVAKKIGVDLTDNDIDELHRAGP